MISEDLWRLIRRWFWLIGLIAAAGVAAAIALTPMMSGATSEYHSSVTLGIRRVVSPGDTDGSADPDLLADYTTSVAGRAKTPQFVAKLHDVLLAEGVDVPENYLAGTYDVIDDRGLSRITVDVTAGSEGTANLIAQSVADLVVAELAAEETRVRESLREGLDSEREDLLANLGAVTEARIARLAELGDAELQATIDNVVRRGIGTNLPEEARDILADLEQITGDPELAILGSREVAIHDELARVATVEQSLANDVRGNPVFELIPVDTVQTETPGTRVRDAAVLGLLAGGVLGWIVANIAERNDWHIRRPGRARAPKQSPNEGPRPGRVRAPKQSPNEVPLPGRVRAPKQSENEVRLPETSRREVSS